MPAPLRSMIGPTAALALALAAATSLAIAAWLGLRHPECGGGVREAVRFPAPPRCGIRVLRADSDLGSDVRVQTGMIILAQPGPAASTSGGPDAVDALVPAWARDRLVPWGWNGDWQVGRWSCRRMSMRGWPWPALASVVEATVATPFDPPQDFGRWRVVEGWGVDGAPATGQMTVSGTLPRVLPTTILWPGLLADTAVLAVPWWVALVGVAWLPRALRRLRGRCSRCGYDLRGLAGGASCPECGGGRSR